MTDTFDINTALAQATALYQAGRFVEAMTACERILSHAPEDAKTITVYALALRAKKQWGRAEKVVRSGLVSNPKNASLHNTLGLIALDQRRLVEAEAAFRDAVAQGGGKQDFTINLARGLHENGKVDEAKVLLEDVIESGRPLSNAYILRASVLSETGDQAAARSDLNEAEKRAGKPYDIAVGRAYCAMAEGDLNRAWTLFDAAVGLTPDVADARVNRGTVRLLQGRISEGWNDYQQRHRRRWSRSVKRPFTVPPWQGEDLTGKSILVWAEQGLGETVLCSSLLADLIGEAETVLLECNGRLTSLFEQSFPGLTVVRQSDPPTAAAATFPADFQASLLDLIRYRAADAASTVSRAESLRADADATASLRNRYQAIAEDKKLIGLSWASPQAAGDRMKSLSPAALQPLFDVSGVAFVNLQYGLVGDTVAEMAAASGVPFIGDDQIDPSGPLDPVANQVAACDSVMTVSTTVAHLAGALGKQTAVILPPLGPAAMWYWFTDREDSPWYPNVRLYRRQHGSDADVNTVASVAGDLRTWLESDR